MLRARFQRTSPQKAKLVLDLIKGLRVEKAINTVAFTNKRIAPVVEKVLRSAVQNAQHLSDERGLDIDIDNLYVKTRGRERGTEDEAHPPCSYGPCVPLSAPHRAHHHHRG